MVSDKKEPSPYRRFYTKDADLQQWVKQIRRQEDARHPHLLAKGAPKPHLLKKVDENV